MSTVPGDLDTDTDLSFSLPLRHFVVGLVFLVAGALLGVGAVADLVPGQATLAQVHLRAPSQ